jgi:hypothetical protein
MSIMRVEVPAHTDYWMRGDRYGEVVKILQKKVNLDDGTSIVREMIDVKLDKSGKIVRLRRDDCTEVT